MKKAYMELEMGDMGDRGRGDLEGGLRPPLLGEGDRMGGGGRVIMATNSVQDTHNRDVVGI